VGLRPLRLGLLSTARINAAIVRGAAASEAVDVVAVASRDPDRAREHAALHGIPRAHGSYAELLADPEVDAVYVPLPNGLHVDWTVAALEAGKHVLCEKPMSPDPAAVARAFDAAEREGLVLSEAFMWRHLPQTRALVEALPRIGDLRLVRVAFSFDLDRGDDVRLSTALEGGALMDVGCYCLSAIRLLAGKPEEVAGHAVRGGDGVDVRFTASLRMPGDVLGLFDCAMDLPDRRELEVVGADGRLLLRDPWFGAAPQILVEAGGAVEELTPPAADPYRLELEDLAAAVAGERAPLLGREDAVGQARGLQALLGAAAQGTPVALP
jgi:predicted dehydrogenase